MVSPRFLGRFEHDRPDQVAPYIFEDWLREHDCVYQFFV
jgi:hypothetical protein